MQIFKMNKKIILPFILTILFFIGGHLLDVGSNTSWGCNGFWCIRGIELFHVGYYGMYAMFVIMVFMYLKEVTG